jgi:electron transfer flavoprotein alpha subunit
VNEVKAPAAAALDVSEATIIVSGGRGLKEPANFALLESLAAAIGGRGRRRKPGGGRPPGGGITRHRSARPARR